MLFIFIFLVFSLFLNFTLILELIVLKRKEKASKKIVQSNFDQLVNLQSIEAPVKNKEFQEVNKKKFDWNIPSSIGQETLKTPLINSPQVFPPIFETYNNQNILNQPNDFLVNWLQKSKKGFFPLSTSEVSGLILNPILVDIESSSKQLLVGFYFSNLNTFVQFIVDVDDPKSIQEKFVLILNNFFIELSHSSIQISKDFQNLQDLNETPILFTCLVGYNLNNYDLPVLDKLLQIDLVQHNPIVQTRLLINELLTVRDRSDFEAFSPLFQNILFVDLFWKTGGRLKEWFMVLNESKLFPTLPNKRFDKSKYERVPEIRIYDWYVYNRNDLLATHFLGLFRNNYFNYILERLVYAKTLDQTFNLISVFQKRYLK
jgi:hypothetical protein